MANQQTGEMDSLERIAIALERIADCLEAQQQPHAPNFSANIEEFKSFDWGSIGATVDKTDQYGAAIVSYRGKQYLRRSPNNNFSPAIYFSRGLGKDESGKNLYERLITFKQTGEVNPVSRKAEAML